ncbi:hypothetical protein L1887_23922 [Cichorium endivia]|nr:hypothetical protein L1887_23922 [Cichorium endivia]
MVNLRRTYASVSLKFNEVLTKIKHYLSREPRLPVVNTTNLGFMVSSLLNFLQLVPDSPFMTHPKTVFVALASLVMYWVSCDAEDKFSVTNHVYTNIARHGRIIFGSLLLASLTSILVPSYIQPIVYIVYIAFYGYELFRWLYKKIMDEVRQIEAQSP